MERKGIHSFSISQNGDVILKKRIGKRLVVIGFTTAAVFVLFMFAICIYYNRLTNYPTVCTTKSCIKSSMNILDSMDDNTDPCEDFYQFTCGNFEENYLSFVTSQENSWDTIITQKTLAIIKRFLEKENDDSEPESIYKTRMFYKSCLKAYVERDNVNKTIDAIATVWKDIGFDTNYLADSVPINAENYLAKIKNNLDVDVFFGLNVYDDPRNSSKTLLIVHQPNVIPDSKNRFNVVTGDNVSEDVLRFTNVYESLVDVLLNQTQKISVPKVHDLLNTSQEFRNFTKNLTIIQEYQYPNKSSIPELFTIEKLQNFTDRHGKNFKFNWTTFLSEIFMDTEPEVYKIVTSADLKILVYNADYIADVFSILSNTSKVLIKMSLLQNGLKVMNNILPNELQNEKYCILNTKEFFSMVTGYALKYTLNDDNKIAVNTMIDNIIMSFRDMIMNSKWMDEESKIATLEKLVRVRSFVGYPDNYENMLDKLYGELNVTDDHTKNILNIIKQRVKLLWTKLVQSTDVDELEWEVSPDEVNAYNLNSRVAFFLSAAILQNPMYFNGVQSLNYGATGSTIGHELSHNFDNTGILYNELGNVIQWWTNKTILEYGKKIQCMVDYFDGIKIKIKNETFELDGVLTLDENIADILGLKQAYFAYQRYVKAEGKEPRLPGLEKYTNEQLFFIGYASQYCHYNYKNPEDMMTNEHSPNTVRVRNILSLMPDFAKVWSCPVGSKMNPEIEKCQLW
ncbi:endothelin-converting enzyme 1-like isoform X2 [Daktulosphaira vitifoliae]|nr:endothelin-converting enzyme 1-like isoform X2 [Daktulosphaira vitifoliae]XP_050538390.1 endothelin-converting enzyme 1-like isoform X2 [Daktulosphaira vitifoliae]